MTSSFYKKQIFRFVQKVQNFFVLMRQHPVFSFLFFFGIVVSLFGILELANAAGIVSSAGSSLRDELIYALVNIGLVLSKLFITASIFFLRFFLNLASYNNYIDTNTVRLGWLMIRDIANMFFVVILLVIAFMTILGAGGYEWKKSMGKLIFAAIFINFSNLICGLIIDAAHVFTMTFLSAIINTAGGNLIQMFSFDKVFQMVNDGSLANGDMTFELLGASALIVFLTGLIAYTMGAFLLVMVARVVVLWALIILSPLAFLMQATPRGEKYASEWWSKFLNHVLVAPIMVFFLWLTFATMGTGDVYQKDIAPGMAGGTPALSESAEPGIENKLSISKVTTWENIANIILAIAFMRVAIMMVGRLDVEGGKFTQGAWGFATKVATIASGVSLARAGAERGGQFAKEKGKELGAGLAKFAYTKTGARELVEKKKAEFRMKAPLVGYEAKQAAAEKAAKVEQAIAEGKYGKIGGYVVGAWNRAVTSPTLREEKKAEAWHKVADDAREIMEMNLKTSETTVGKARGTMATELEAQTALSNQKKDEKRKQLMLEIQMRSEGKSDEQIRAKLLEDRNEMTRRQMLVAGKSEEDIAKKIASQSNKEDEENYKPILLASDFLGEGYMKKEGSKLVDMQGGAVKSKLTAEQFDRSIEALSSVTLRGDTEAQVMARIKAGKKADSASSALRLEDLERELSFQGANARAKVLESRGEGNRADQEMRRWANSDLGKQADSIKSLDHQQKMDQFKQLAHDISDPLIEAEQKNVKIRELTALADSLVLDPKDLREALEGVVGEKVTDKKMQMYLKGVFTGSLKDITREEVDKDDNGNIKVDAKGNAIMKKVSYKEVDAKKFEDEMDENGKVTRPAVKADDVIANAWGGGERGQQMSQTLLSRLSSNAFGGATIKGDFDMLSTVHKETKKIDGRAVPVYSLDEVVTENDRKERIKWSQKNMTARNILSVDGLRVEGAEGKTEVDDNIFNKMFSGINTQQQLSNAFTAQFRASLSQTYQELKELEKANVKGFEDAGKDFKRKMLSLAENTNNSGDIRKDMKRLFDQLMAEEKVEDDYSI
ncbi:MAG: hypothetical protein V1848_03145 [Candidatus Magasanikbacteria bacterium]